MANLEELKKNLEAATTAMGTLNSQAQATNKYSEGIVKSLSDLASMKTKQGTIWTIFGRLSAGTGLYNIQNRLRGITVFFRLISDIEEDRVKKSNEYNETLKQHGGLLKSGLDTYRKINKGIAEQNEGLFEVYTRLDDASNIYLKQLSFTELLNKRQEESVKLVSKQLKIERQLVEEQGEGYKLGKEAQKIMRKSGLTGPRKLFSEDIGGFGDFFSSLTNRNKKTFGKGIGDFVASLTDPDFYESQEMSKQLLNLSEEFQFFTGILKDEKAVYETALSKEKQFQQELEKIRDEEKKIKLDNIKLEQAQRVVPDQLDRAGKRKKRSDSIAEQQKIRNAMIARDEEILKNKERLMDLDRERIELNEAIEENKKKINKEQIDLLEEETNKRKDLMNILEDELKEKGVSVEKDGDTIKGITREGRPGLLARRFGKGGQLTKKGFTETLKKQTKALGSPIVGLLTFFKASFLSYLTKKNFNKLFNFAKTGIMVFVQIIYAITLLGLLVFILHKSGFIDGVKKFIEENQATLVAFKEMAIEAGKGIFEFLSGFVTFIAGLFSGDSSKVMSGLSKMFGGLRQYLENFVPLLFGVLGMLVAGLSMGIANAAVTVVTGVGKALKDMFSDIKGTAKKSAAAISMGLLGTAIGFAIGGPVGAIVGGTIGAGIGFATKQSKGEMAYNASTSIDGMFASGGTVLTDGRYLVGEKGPEIVNLPAGASVFNNQQTRSMMGGNTINVSVNGRVGASDAELDDLARKLGRKINLEMNRYNNTGYRA